jgi:membrane protein involved in colicin uptake
VETAARQKAEAEARALAEKKAAEDAAAAKAAEAARKAEEQKNLLPFDPTGGVLRGGALAAPQDGGMSGQPADEQPTVQTPPQGLDFNTLPGVTPQ